MRVRAVDARGNTSAWRYLVVRPVVYQSLAAGVRYRKPTPWSMAWASASSGTGYRYSTVKGGSATYGFTGREVAWVAPRLPGGGTADVYVDGARVTSVNLRSATTVWARPVFRAVFASAGPHTVKLVVTSSGRRVTLDAFMVLR